jgi:hypothetical protein
MLPKVPVALRAAAGVSVLSLPGDVPAVGDSAPLSKLRDRLHLSFKDLGESGKTGPGPPKRKIWTVSVVDETQSRVELRLNDML